VQERCGPAVTGRFWRWLGFGAGGEDSFDGAVAGVADGDCLAAGGLQPDGSMLIGQTENALRCA
jgi:hypothetical protein